jgi:hypothetical protein
MTLAHGKKIYQPNSVDKQWRFSYAGKPKRHVLD